MSNVNVTLHADAQRSLDAESNALLKQLVGATPAQVDAYMTANVTTLAQARTVLTALALAVRYLYLHGD